MISLLLLFGLFRFEIIFFYMDYLDWLGVGGAPRMKTERTNRHSLQVVGQLAFLDLPQ